MPGTNSDGSSINWKTVALIGAPIALIGLAGAYIYYTKSVGSATSELENKPINKTQRTGSVSGNDSGTESEDPLIRAIAHKNRGNKWFKVGKYAQAIECYNKALEICPSDKKEELSTFYQNRAASYENLKQYEESLADCNNALRENPRYVKAFARRAKLLEEMGRLEECLEDITAVCILEKFSNQDSLTRADRVLKAVGKLKSEEEIAKWKPSLPSDTFMKAYFSSFANDPFHNKAGLKRASNIETGTSANSPGDSKLMSLNDLNLDESADLSSNGHSNEVETHGDNEQIPQGDENAQTKLEEYNKKRRSLLHIEEQLRKYQFEFCYNSIEQSVKELESDSNLYEDLCRARLLRGTFYALRGENELARQDFDWVAVSHTSERDVLVNALIKRASLYMTMQQDLDKCMDTFRRAIDVWPECSDIFHHRGQINLIADRLEEALNDLAKAVRFDPDFSITQAQSLYTRFRIITMGMKFDEAVNVLDEFAELARKYPKCSETHSLYAQALLELGRFVEARDEFKKVLSIDPLNGTAHVHQGMLALRADNDVDKALSLMKKAVEIDPKCEFAYEMLATVAVQQGKFEDALSHFKSAIALTKTPNELAHLVSLREAVIAQVKVSDRYGISVGDLASSLLSQSGGVMA